MQCVIFLTVLFATLPSAYGYNFERQIDGDQVLLRYQFTDIEGTHQQFQLTLSRDAILTTPTQFRPLSTQRLQRAVLQRQRQYAQQQGWRNAQVSLRNGELTYSFVGPGDHQQHVRQWRAQEPEAFASVLEAHYYQSLRQHSGRRGYAPDHPRLALESRDLLSPLASQFEQLLQAQYGEYTPRQALAYLSHFIQQIPYADLHDRFSSPGAGFLAPARLLFENKGDCDSKVTLLATLMAEMFAELERRIVYLPGHAVFALELEPEDDDIYLRDHDLKFVIADPTGPAALRVGKAARRYQSHLVSGAVNMLAI